MTALPPLTDRGAAINALLTELRHIEGPTTNYRPWWAKVRDINVRLAEEGQPRIGLEDLSGDHRRRRA